MEVIDKCMKLTILTSSEKETDYHRTVVVAFNLTKRF